MIKKYEKISPQFFDLIFEAMAKGFFIEAICLIL